MAASSRLMSHLPRSVGVSLAAMCKDSEQAALLYHLVGETEQPIRHGKAERLRGIEVDHHAALGWLQDRHISRRLAVQNATSVHSDLTIDITSTRPIAATSSHFLN